MGVGETVWELGRQCMSWGDSGQKGEVVGFSLS